MADSTTFPTARRSYLMCARPGATTIRQGSRAHVAAVGFRQCLHEAASSTCVTPTGDPLPRSGRRPGPLNQE
jgi:hypothetical protein